MTCPGVLWILGTPRALMLSPRVPRMVPLSSIEQDPKFQKTSSGMYPKYYPSLRRPPLEGRLHAPSTHFRQAPDDH